MNDETNDDTHNDLMPVDEFVRNELEVLITDSFRAAREKHDPNNPLAFLPEWYLGKLRDLKYAKEVLQVQYNKMLAQIAAREKALDWKWGQDFQAQVNRDLDVQSGNSKSKDYLTGRAGFRKTGGGEKLLLTDGDEALKHALPRLIKRTLDRTKLKAYLRGGGVLSGAKLIQTDAKDSFFPSITQPLLEQGDTEDGDA